MRSSRVIVAIVFICIAGFTSTVLLAQTREPRKVTTPAAAEAPRSMADLAQISFAGVLARAIPSVVTVRVTSEDPVPVELRPGDGLETVAKPQTRLSRSGGSGVIIDAANGHILTNNHVSERAIQIEVVLSDGRLMPARLVGLDVGADLAVIEVADRRLQAIPMGDSDKVRVGDVVLAIGNPFGLEGTATMGIVSASMRSEVGHEAFEDFFQIDAVVNPGNSGGALVNTRGELIGINTAIAGTSGNVGIGFAIPINMARIVKGQIVRYGHMRRGALGLIVEDLSYERAATLMSGTNRGAVVTAVVPGSPAALAGIVPGAIVTEIAGKPVRGAAEFKTRVVTVPLGTELSLVLRSEGQDRRYILATAKVLETGPEHTLTAADGGLAGLTVTDIAPGNPLFGELRGAQVVRIASGSHAAQVGLQTGDVIVGIDNFDIRQTEHLFRYAERTGMSYRLKLQRKGVAGWLRVVR